MKINLRDPEKERPLFDYQKTTFDLMSQQWAEGEHPYYGLFYQMRLGKSILALRFCKAHNLTRTLIVCPLSIVEPTWKKELTQENLYPFIFTDSYLQKVRRSPSLRSRFPIQYQHIDDIWPDPLSEPLYKNLFCVTNYEHLRSNKSGLADRDWDCVIIDESTKLGNPDNQITKFCRNNFRSAKCRMVLAGNPSPNSLADYFEQICFLKDSFLGYRNWWEFTRAHFYALSQANNLRPYKTSVPLLESDLSRYCYKLKRQDVDIGSKKLYEQKTIPFDKSYRLYYDYMETNWALNETKTSWALVAKNFLHQMCGGFPQFERNVESYHKLKELLALLKGDLAEEKVVIWTKFRHEQSIVYNRVRDFFPATAIVNSSVKIDQRSRIIELFNTSPDINILICTYGTLDFGIDLSAADTTIYFSNPWSRIQREQSEDRIVHPEKKNPLLYIDLISEDSVDCDVLQSYLDKIARTDVYNDIIYDKFLKRMAERGVYPGYGNGQNILIDGVKSSFISTVANLKQETTL